MEKSVEGIDVLSLDRIQVVGEDFSQLASIQIGNMGLTHASQARIAFCPSLSSG